MSPEYKQEPWLTGFIAVTEKGKARHLLHRRPTMLTERVRRGLVKQQLETVCMRNIRATLGKRRPTCAACMRRAFDGARVWTGKKEKF